MKATKSRGLILLLSFLSLISALSFKNRSIALGLMALCVLGSLLVLYRHLGELTELSPENPKMNTLKLVTVFDAAIFTVCALLAALLGAGVISLRGDGRYTAAALVAALMLFAGNIAPKLPFNRHTGLRLPWTVTDENTWTVAHRILSYISLPLALVYLSGAAIFPGFGLWTLVIMLLWLGIPGGLSYVFFRRGG